MIDEHSRESELEVQIIGLKGKIDSLKKELKENKEEFLDDLREVMEWSKNELPFDSETNTSLKRKEKIWENRKDTSFEKIEDIPKMPEIYDDMPICSECNSNDNVKPFGDTGFYNCEVCNNKFYIEMSRELEEPRNIATLELEDVIVNVLTFNPKREIAFNITGKDNYDVGITILKNKDEEF